jgi:hypothetical protein
MRIRPIHIVAGVMVLVAVVVAFAMFQQPDPRTSGSAAGDDAFLERIRQQAQSADFDQEEGTMPGAMSDRNAVPRIELEMAEVDLGTVPNDELYNSSIAVYNRGKADLIINGIDTECACTEGTMENSVIPPGETGRMIIQINPYRIPGFTSTKALSIRTNDPIKRLVRLPVTCQVEPEFEYEPRVTDFGEIEPGSSPEAEIILRQLGDEPIELEGVEAVGELASLLEISTEPIPEDEWLAEGKPEYRVGLRLKPLTQGGQLTIPYVVKTTCERVPEYRGSVRAIITSDINVIPSNLSDTPRDETDYSEESS